MRLHSLLQLDFQLLAVSFLVLLAADIDVRTRRIPNWLILVGIAMGFGYHCLSTNGNGALFSLAGMAIGVAAFIFPYAMRLIGAGDVKLMGTVGAFLGVRGAVDAVLLTLVAGGILAIAITIRKRMVRRLTTNLSVPIGELKIPHMGLGRLTGKMPSPSEGNIPYAVAIAAGTIVQLILMKHDYTIF